ncbi:MAG: hypothetical protein H0U98_10625 [Alphaproteobacteria bacterium]|nr:hypothetical protein [Alphaproteobacteria bacterium]
MSTPALVPGVAVIYPGTGPDSDGGRPHIHVLVSGPTAKNDILLIPICSTHQKCDRTVVLKPKAGWEDIKWESYAAYYKAKKVSAKVLTKRIESSEITYLGEIPKDAYASIIKGIEDSGETEPWFLEEFLKLK